MNIQEIRVSGLLEQYVIGALDPAEEAVVLQTLHDFPQLKEDLDQITDVLRAYNKLNLKEIPSDLKGQVIEAFNNAEVISTSRRGYNKPKTTKSNRSKKTEADIPWAAIFGGLAALFAIACGVLYFMSDGKTTALNNQIVQLEESVKSKNQEIASLVSVKDSLSELSSPNNIWSTLKPSLRYREAEMYIIKNPASNESYAKINNLPDLPTGRSYKVWTQSATGNYTELPESISYLKSDFMNKIEIPLDATRLVISIHRDGVSLTPTTRTIIGTIDL